MNTDTFVVNREQALRRLRNRADQLQRLCETGHVPYSIIAHSVRLIGEAGQYLAAVNESPEGSALVTCDSDGKLLAVEPIGKEKV